MVYDVMDMETEKPVLIACRELCKDYVMGEEVLHALSDVTVDIEKGEYVAVMGPSGSGKSTLMNLIGALDKPTKGGLYIDGQDLTRMDSDNLAEFRNKTVGFVFQQFNLLARTTALENAKLPMLYSHEFSGEEMVLRARRSLERVGLGDRMHHEPTQLSGGQQQRVAIARALVNDPELILADEPTGALDSHSSVEILELFQELNDSGITIIMVTHDPEVAAFSRRNLMFLDGRIIDDVRTGIREGAVV